MNLSDPIFHDDNAARSYMEAQRWADGVVCPHCGGVEKCKRLEGAKHRPGLFQCGDCRKQFTVTVGTIFERSKVSLSKWMLATHLMASSKKGMSAHQLHRSIGVTYKTAWFMWHRIREAMSGDAPAGFGSGGGVVEVDETFIGREPGKEVKRGVGHKMKVLTLVDRTTGKAESVRPSVYL
ncbi:MAG: IS1595 family transposase [Rhodobacter sp.]|nr:IS1595 family transposase [Rhodobacter sp.]